MKIRTIRLHGSYLHVDITRTKSRNNLINRFNKKNLMK